MEHLKNQLIEKYPFAQSGVIQQLNYNDAINAILLIHRDPDKLSELNRSLHSLVDLMYTNQPLFNYTEYARYPNIQKSLAIINSTMKRGGANDDIELTSLFIGIIVAIVIMVGIGMTWSKNHSPVSDTIDDTIDNTIAGTIADKIDADYYNALSTISTIEYSNEIKIIINNIIDIGYRYHRNIYDTFIRRKDILAIRENNPVRFLAGFASEVAYINKINNKNLSAATINIIKKNKIIAINPIEKFIETFYKEENKQDDNVWFELEMYAYEICDKLISASSITLSVYDDFVEFNNPTSLNFDKILDATFHEAFNKLMLRKTYGEAKREVTLNFPNNININGF